MRPSSVGLKVFFSGCGFEFLWFFSRQRWKLFPSATHAYVNKVSDNACQWNGHDVVISIGGIFFIERFVRCMTKKSWAFSYLVAAISSALFVVNMLTVFLSFVIFIKILFDNWRRFRRLSIIFVLVKCPRGGGIWSPEWTPVWGIWTAFWPGRGEFER